MHRPRIGSLALAAAFAATALIPLVSATPASAFVVGGGCKNSVFAGAELGWFSAASGSQSYLRVACLFDSRTGSSLVSPKFTIHDGRFIQYHQGAARTVTTVGITPPGAACVNISSSLGLLGYVNHPVSGGPFSSVPAATGLLPRAFQTSIVATACGGGAGNSMNLNNPTGGTAIPAGTALRIDNANGRSSIQGTTVPGGVLLTVTDANFQLGPAETGCVSGTNIQSYTTYTATGAATATLSLPALAAIPPGGETITLTPGLPGCQTGVGLTTTRTVKDSAATCAAGMVTSATAFFSPTDVGLPFYGCGAGAGSGAIITATAPGPPSTATIGGFALTPSGPGLITFTIGDPTVTAPLDDQAVLQQSVMLDLSPSLVSGSGDCAADEPEGFGISGKLRNPGPGPLPNGFFTNAFATQPADTKAIAQILFTTSVVSFGAFVVEHEAGQAPPPGYPVEPIGVKHYDIVFPNTPTGLALCASANSPGLGISIGVNGTTVSQAALGTGLGLPGTAQFRNTSPKATAAGFNSTIYMYDDNNPRIWLPAANFNRLCVFPADPAPVSFQCGDG